MARGTHALGGQYRGRIGGKTLYVRNGQQIVYERTGGRRTPVDTRHQLPNLALILAHRWKAQLGEDGVVVELSVMLEWAYSILRAPVNGNVDLVDAGDGAWSASGVKVVNGKVTCLLRSPNATQGRDYKQPWGESFMGQTGFRPLYVYDRPLNIYPMGVRFVSVVGNGAELATLKIGRRVNFVGSYFRGTTIQSDARWWGVQITGRYIHWSNKNVNMEDVAYSIGGWAPPRLVLPDGLVLAWAVIRADGVPIEMHTRFVDT